MTPELAKKIKIAMPRMPEHEQINMQKLLEEYEKSTKIEDCTTNFMAFVHQVWPTFIHGAHHEKMAAAFERIVSGETKRLILNLPPRHTKSEFASYLLPAWFLGKNPAKKVIQTSHTAELAVGFGRKVRNLVDSEVYKEVFPELGLQTDSKAAGRWNTNKGGDYFAIGVGGAVTGKGADILIIDDPHALTLDTEVPTPKGFKTIQELEVGDFVYGPDGKATRVIDKSEVWHNREVYEITTSDGEVIKCDGGHLWNFRSDTKIGAPHKNATARKLALWDKKSKPCLPRHAAVQYPHTKLPVDPYVLGAWLGDGTTGLGRMTSHPYDMPFMREQFENVGYTTTTLTSPYSFGIKGLRAELHKLQVRDNKHIPQQYLTASIPQRMALVQGLMDTDGDVSEAGQCSFNNTNKKLAEQFRELIHSLGVKAKIHCYQDKRPNHNPVYRVTYKLKNCCRMPRKNERTYTPTDKRCRSIKVWKTTDFASMQCITVEREDGLFLVGRGYVVTHNSEQEAALAEVNPEIYDKTYEWYTSGPRQRLQPGGAIIIVMCMTGDTRVLLANGKEKELHSIKVGDEVATYDSGKITTSKVLNWQSNGFDFTYRITTNCGTIVYANERHPFLVDNNGVRQWIRLKDLKKGMLLVATRTVEDPHEHKQDREDFVPHAKQHAHTTRITLAHRTYHLVHTASGKGLHVLKKAVMNLYPAKGCVPCTTTKQRGVLENAQQPQNIEEISASSPDMGLTAQGILSYLKPKKVFVQCVKSLRDRMLGRTGVENCVLTTATKQEKLEGCYVMTATSPSGMVKQKQSCSVPQNTYEIILEEITDVTPYGYEEVFDVEIERTENFIANGLVSHNTRWSKKDLTGRVLKSAAQRNDEGWEIIEFPALLPSGRPLWPEFWVKSELEALKLELPNSKWMAQYQQQPTSEESAIIKREWWNKWEKDDPPSCEFVIQSWDTAFLKTQRADYSACTTWGIFYREDATGKKQANIILLDVLKERMEFPELKETAKQMYKEWEPDALIVEAKASGAPLVFELRATGIPVQEFVPSRGNDKIARLNAVSDIFASGRVWVPETSWAEELVDEVASFPAGDHDDLVDSMTQALLRFRRGGFLQLDSDYDDEPLEFRRSKGKALYTV